MLSINVILTYMNIIIYKIIYFFTLLLLRSNVKEQNTLEICSTLSL